MGYTAFAGAGEWTGAPKGAPTHGLYGLNLAAGQWSHVEGLPADIEVRDFAVHPARAGVIFAGSQLGPLRSTDGGETWQVLPLPGNTTPEERVVWSMTIHPRGRIRSSRDAGQRGLSKRRWRRQLATARCSGAAGRGTDGLPDARRRRRL